VDLPKLAAHYAISSLFDSRDGQEQIYCYSASREEYRVEQREEARLATGRARFTSGITGESARLSFAVIHLGQHNIQGGVRECAAPEADVALFRQLREALASGAVPDVVELLERAFGDRVFTLKTLLRDEQRRILEQILAPAAEEAEAAFRRVYEERIVLIRFLAELGMPLPRAFRRAAEFAISSSLRHALAQEEIPPARMQSLLGAARMVKAGLDHETLEFTFRKTIEKMAARFAASPDDLPLLRKLEQLLALGPSLPFSVNLWKVQNIFHAILGAAAPGYQEAAGRGDQHAREWIACLRTVSEKLSLRME